MRATQRLTAPLGALLVIDLQEKLVAAVADGPGVVANAVRLVRGPGSWASRPRRPSNTPRGSAPPSRRSPS